MSNNHKWSKSIIYIVIFAVIAFVLWYVSKMKYVQFRLAAIGTSFAPGTHASGIIPGADFQSWLAAYRGGQMTLAEFIKRIGHYYSMDETWNILQAYQAP
jgi:hypothetical protein